MTAASPLHLLNSADENYNNFCQALVRGYPEYLRSSGLITYNKICQDLVDEANKRISEAKKNISVQVRQK